jgi:hypothetical protein
MSANDENWGHLGTVNGNLRLAIHEAEDAGDKVKVALLSTALVRTEDLEDALWTMMIAAAEIIDEMPVELSLICEGRTGGRPYRPSCTPDLEDALRRFTSARARVVDLSDAFAAAMASLIYGIGSTFVRTLRGPLSAAESARMMVEAVAAAVDDDPASGRIVAQVATSYPDGPAVLAQYDQPGTPSLRHFMAFMDGNGVPGPVDETTCPAVGE